MSQWGAQALAARGLDHAAILAHFYPGTRLETPSAAVSAGEGGR
jgi:SpoIID/LytB domain protein